MSEPFDRDLDEKARASFRRRLETIEPLVRSVDRLPREAVPAARVRPVGGLGRRRVPAALLVGVTVVAIAAILGTQVFHDKPSASPSTTHGSTPPSATPNGSAPPTAGWQELRPASSLATGQATAVVAQWNGATVVATSGKPASMWYSSDGKAWENVAQNDVFGDVAIEAVVPGVSSLTALGHAYAADGKAGPAIVWSSSDGRSWSRVDTGGTYAPTSSVMAVHGRAGFVVFPTGTSGDAWTSRDGVRWKRSVLQGAKSAPGWGAAAGIAANSRAYVAVAGGTVWRSSEGEGWAFARALTTEAGMQERLLVLGDRFFVYESPAGDQPQGAQWEVRRAWTSEDGYEWTPIAVPPTLVSPVASNGALIVATRRGAPSLPREVTLQQSSDGVQWSDLPVNGGGSIAGVVAVVPSGVFVAGQDSLQFLAAFPPPPPPTPSTGPAFVWPKAALEFGDGHVGPVAGGGKGWVAFAWRDGRRQIWYSADGATFARSSQGERDLKSANEELLIGTPTGFLLVANDQRADPMASWLWWSSDGQHWSKAAGSGKLGWIAAVAWGKAGFVVMNRSDQAWRSTDLKAWDGPYPTHGGPYATQPGDLPRLRLVGSDVGYLAQVDDGKSVRMLWSPDGKTWTRTPLGGADVRFGSGVALARDGMVALAGGDPSRAWVSKDGTTWTEATGADAWNFWQIACDRTWMYAAHWNGTTAQLLRSRNGVDWERVVLGASPYAPLGAFQPIAAGGGSVAVGFGNSFWILPQPALANTEPVTAPKPTPRPTPPPPPTPVPPPDPSRSAPPGGWRSLQWASGPAAVPTSDADAPQLIAVGPKGIVQVSGQTGIGTPTIRYSGDFTTLRPADTSAFGSAYISRLRALPEGFIAQGDLQVNGPSNIRAAIWTSPDGRTWRQVDTGHALDGGHIYDMAAGAGGLIAVGSVGDLGRPAVWRSPDGVAWSAVDVSDAFAGAMPLAVAGSSTYGWLIAGQVSGQPGGAAVWRSSDGVSWRRQLLPGGLPQANHVYLGSAGILVTAEDSMAMTATAWSSGDGDNWARQDDPNSTLKTIADGSRILRTDGHWIEESIDGTTWHLVSVEDRGYIEIWNMGPAGLGVSLRPSATGWTKPAQTWYLTASPA